jgi:hypothetical protein
MEIIFLLLIGLLVLGPLSHFFGVDSRVRDERGWWPDRR